MKKTILKKIFRIITEEYEFFSHLSVGSRIGIALSLTLLYFTLVILIHLTLYPYLVRTSNASMTLGIIYFFVLILATITNLPVLFPKLKKISSLVIFIILFLNFFPLAIIAFLMPKLRKHKTVVIGILIYMNIMAAGLVIMLNGINEGILTQQPDTNTIILWFIGVISIFSSIFIHSYVIEKISVEKTQTETEVKIAQDIQLQLVPLIELREDSYNVFGKMKPAYHIGGDFFDLVRLSNKKFMVAIGDVSGHNIAASLLMAITKSAFRTALQHTSSLNELAESMNRTIIDNSDKKMFVTFKCGVFDLTTNSITVVNAGYLPLLHYKSKTKTVLEYNQYGLALGLSDQANYTSEQIFFDKGDLFALVTDGFAEARNSSDVEFSFERIKDLIESFAAESELKTLYEKLMAELCDFTGSQSFKDDATFLSVKII